MKSDLTRILTELDIDYKAEYEKYKTEYDRLSKFVVELVTGNLCDISSRYAEFLEAAAAKKVQNEMEEESRRVEELHRYAKERLPEDVKEYLANRYPIKPRQTSNIILGDDFIDSSALERIEDSVYKPFEESN